MSGDHARAAQLLAALSESEPQKDEIARKALAEAIGSGQMDLALKLTRSVPATTLPAEARLLLVAEEIRRGRADRALPWLTAQGQNGVDLSFLSPLIAAWAEADRGNAARAIAAIDGMPATNPLTALASEERALLLLKARRTAEAETPARQAVGRAGAREQRLRLAFADGFLAAGDRQRALMIIDGMGAGETAARQRIMAGKTSGQAIDNLSEAFGEVLTAFAADLTRMQRSAPPIGIVQIAHYINPQSSSTTALLALLLARQDRTDEALALLRTLPASDAFIA